MKSVLKWVGAKHNIMASLKHVLPKGGRLIEPFGGSGAVMMNTNYPEYILADINSDLIDTYQSILSRLKRYFLNLNAFTVSGVLRTPIMSCEASSIIMIVQVTLKLLCLSI
jgi:site-specific DNA-adenine methylase